MKFAQGTAKAGREYANSVRAAMFLNINKLNKFNNNYFLNSL
jgi:hypothetical protein